MMENLKVSKNEYRVIYKYTDGDVYDGEFKDGLRVD